MKPLKIGIDCRYLLVDFPAGPEKYAFNLVSALSKIDSKNKYTLYFEKTPDTAFFQKLTNSASNFMFKVPSSAILRTQIGLFRELKNNPVDVFFAPFHTLPFLASTRFFNTTKTAWISMIHGIEYAEEHKSFLKGIWLNALLKRVSKHSDVIIVPSAHTKEELVKRSWVKSESKVSVIPEGVGSEFRHYSPEEIYPTLKLYALETVPYLIFISTIQPRKNVPNLIAGFAKAIKDRKISQDTKLVLVGKKGWDYEESLSAPQKYRVEENVVFLGRVSDGDLPLLLSGAKAYISVSFEEGFGLPLLEAMASKVPCVISDIPSYRSLAGDFPVFVNPQDIDAISKGISTVLHESRDLEGAFKRCWEYTWEATARKTLNVFLRNDFE